MSFYLIGTNFCLHIGFKPRQNAFLSDNQNQSSRGPLGSKRKATNDPQVAELFARVQQLENETADKAAQKEEHLAKIAHTAPHTKKVRKHCLSNP